MIQAIEAIPTDAQLPPIAPSTEVVNESQSPMAEL